MHAEGVLVGNAQGNAAEAAEEAAAEALQAAAVDAGLFPGLGANPFFVGIPSCNFRTSADPLEMRTAHQQVWLWVKQKLAEQVGNVQVNYQGQVKIFNFLPATPGGYFIVNLFPPESWDDKGMPIPLLFSFHNLYLLGFPNGHVWHVYNDAKLDGIGYDEQQHKKFITKLNFSGGYDGNMFERVRVSVEKIFNTYETLTHFKNLIEHHRQDVVEEAMYRLIILLPEAWRFPAWRSHLQDNAFVTFMGITADDPYTRVMFSPLFQKWDKISKRILDGPDKYTIQKQVQGYNNYGSLLPTVSVLLP